MWSMGVGGTFWRLLSFFLHIFLYFYKYKSEVEKQFVQTNFDSFRRRCDLWDFNEMSVVVLFLSCHYQEKRAVFTIAAFEAKS